MNREPRSTRVQLAAAWTFACMLFAAPARGDGGAVLVTRSEGRFLITVFTSSPPLRAGAVDVSVLVQDREHGTPLLDGDVTFQLSPPAASIASAAPISVAATHVQATNKLLYAALIDLAVPGTWTLRVDVRRGDDAADLSAPLPIAPPTPALRAVWPYLLVPPAAILLFALHQSLARRHLGRT